MPIVHTTIFQESHADDTSRFTKLFIELGNERRRTKNEMKEKIFPESILNKELFWMIRSFGAFF